MAVTLHLFFFSIIYIYISIHTHIWIKVWFKYMENVNGVSSLEQEKSMDSSPYLNRLIHRLQTLQRHLSPYPTSYYPSKLINSIALIQRSASKVLPRLKLGSDFQIIRFPNTTRRKYGFKPLEWHTWPPYNHPTTWRKTHYRGAMERNSYSTSYRNEHVLQYLYRQIFTAKSKHKTRSPLWI